MTAGMERPLGAALGGALSAILFVILRVLPRPTTGFDLFDVAASVVALGGPIAVLLGWRFGPRVSGSNGFGLIGWMGTSAMLLGVVEVLALLLAGELSAGLGVFVFAFFALAYGLGLGLLVLPFTIACAACWFGAFVMIDRLARSGHARSPGVTGASGARVTCS